MDDDQGIDGLAVSEDELFPEEAVVPAPSPVGMIMEVTRSNMEKLDVEED